MTLSPATKRVWDCAPYRFRRGALMGPTELARHVGLCPEGVYYHLRKLERAGLVARVRNGKVKHLYAGIPRKNF